MSRTSSNTLKKNKTSITLFRNKLVIFGIRTTKKKDMIKKVETIFFLIELSIFEKKELK